MTRRIEEDPKRTGFGLDLGLACTQCNDSCFAGIEIVDVEIDVGLLRMLRTRPLRRLMIRGQLKCQRRAVIAA